MKYHTTKTGPDIEDFQSAIKKAIDIAKDLENKEVLIAVPVLANIEGAIKQAFSENAFKQLKKKRHLKVEDVDIYLETKKSKSGFENGVVLATYTGNEWLDELIGDYRTTEIVYVPWAKGELNNYLTNHADSEAI